MLSKTELLKELEGIESTYSDAGHKRQSRAVREAINIICKDLADDPVETPAPTGGEKDAMELYIEQLEKQLAEIKKLNEVK